MTFPKPKVNQFTKRLCIAASKMPPKFGGPTKIWQNSYILPSFRFKKHRLAMVFPSNLGRLAGPVWVVAIADVTAIGFGSCSSFRLLFSLASETYSAISDHAVSEERLMVLGGWAPT